MGELGVAQVADAVRAELDAGGDLPQIPPWRAGLELRYTRDSWSAGVAAHRPLELRRVVAGLLCPAVGLEHTRAQDLGDRRIELPLIVPGVAGGWLIAFINSFDELTMSIFVASAATGWVAVGTTVAA